MYIYFFLFGICSGSFINGCSYRLINNESFYPRSHCDHCNHILSPHELIPILGWIFLKGRCPSCHYRIPARYPLIELLCGILFVSCYIHFELSLKLLFYIPLIITTLLLALIDLDTYIIKDRLVLLCLFFILSLIIIEPNPILECILGFFVLSLPLTLIALITQSIGFGDIKLLAIFGILFGPLKLLFSFMTSCFLAAIPAAYWILTKQKTGQDQIPFGPFLVAGILLFIFLDDTNITELFSFF